MTVILLTFRAEDRLVRALDLIVNTTEKSHQYHLNRAVTRYVKAELASLQAIAEGIIDADAGELINLETALATFSDHGESDT